jgi:hypothetical protein
MFTTAETNHETTRRPKQKDSERRWFLVRHAERKAIAYAPGPVIVSSAIPKIFRSFDVTPQQAMYTF